LNIDDKEKDENRDHELQNIENNNKGINNESSPSIDNLESVKKEVKGIKSKEMNDIEEDNEFKVIKKKEKKKDKKEEKKEKKKKKAKPKTIEEKLLEAQEHTKTWQSKFMYLQAEMENSQKIMLKRIDLVKYSSKVDTIKIFLPIIDTFEAAIAKLVKNPDSISKDECKPYLDGFKRVQNQFLQILENNGVKPIEEIDIPFNYKIHEVLMKFEDNEKQEDTVMQIVQKGWFLDDNILRPAKVIVSKKKELPKPTIIIEQIKDDTSPEDSKKETEPEEKENRQVTENNNTTS
jgi:molecular chaperone GrpE